METAVIFNNLAESTHTAFRDTLQNVSPLSAVVETHSVNVLFKVALLNKFSQSILLKVGYRAGIERQHPVKFVRKMLRQNHIADTDRRSKWFGKRINVDNLLPGINTEKRGQRLSVNPEFTVIIILNDIAAILFISPCQNLVASGNRHGDPARKMMGWT